MMNDEVVDWLLDSDPSVRFQVERDLLQAPEDQWRATRALSNTQGYGSALLAKQDPDGQWAGGAHFPTGTDWQSEPGQPFTATSWSLKSLREWGVDAATLGDTADRLRENCHWEYDDLPFWQGEVDVCINAYTLQSGLWLGQDMSANAQWFAEHVQPDGGFDCEWVNGSTHSSFHSTINALEALLAYEQAGFGTPETTEARHCAEEYLLERRLMYSKRTGQAVGPWVSAFMATPRHVYSALRALDYFREASQLDGAAPDARLADAVALVRSKQQPDGRWLNDYRREGRVWFETDEPVGEASRAVTLRALRVLSWYDAAALPSAG